jgi:hypothetical protein
MHAYLHSASRFALEHAEQDVEGQTYNLIHAIISTAFFVEAYLNFLGVRQIPNWDKTERSLSPMEKYKLLCDHLGMETGKGGKVYQAFQQVFEFRNLMAHGRTETVCGVWIEPADLRGLRRQPETGWEKLCNVRMARRLFECSEKLVLSLHQKAGFNDDPFGSLGHGMAVRRRRAGKDDSND